MVFTDREFQIIHEREFLQTKSVAISKIQNLLSEVRSQLQSSFLKTGIYKSFNENQLSGKISRGENYRGLPYLVLDYPATFLKKDIFAFRTMFWWGNFFSCTLHLQGRFLDVYREQLVNNISLLADLNTYLCINDTPWEYHYEADNYKLLSLDDRDFMNIHPFLKVSKRYELKDWQIIPVEASSFLVHLLDYIDPKPQE